MLYFTHVLIHSCAFPTVVCSASPMLSFLHRSHVLHHSLLSFLHRSHVLRHSRSFYPALISFTHSLFSPPLFSFVFYSSVLRHYCRPQDGRSYCRLQTAAFPRSAGTRRILPASGVSASLQAMIEQHSCIHSSKRRQYIVAYKL